MHRYAGWLTIALFGVSLPLHAAAPQIVSLSPTSGSGQTQAFTLTVSDSAGASDISWVDLLINTSFSGTSACWIAYNRGDQTASVAGDNGFGSGGRSQCTADSVTATQSGNDLTVVFNITFDPRWTGPRTIWADALDQSNSDLGYQQVGTWTVVATNPVPDFTISISPASQTTQPGQSVQYNVTATSVNGFSGDVLYNVATDPQLSGVTIEEQGPAGDIRSFIHVTPSQPGTGVIIVHTSSSTPPTNNITLTGTFQNARIEHTYSFSLSLVAPNGPAITLSPTTGSGSNPTFTITATDQGGFAAVDSISLLINSSLDGRNGCWLYFAADHSGTGYRAGTLALASDDTTSWADQTDVHENDTSVVSVENSQCSVFGGPTTVSNSGNTVTLTITLTFASSFTGLKQVWVRAADVAGPSSGYQQLGSWNATAASGGADFSLGVSPASQSMAGAGAVKYGIIVTGSNGYTGTPNLSVTGLPPNSTLVPPSNVPAGQQTLFTVNTTAYTPAGSYPLTITGTDGALSHTITATLNMLAAPTPALSASPNAGSGTTQTFVFHATGQPGYQAIVVDALISPTLDSRNACWLAFTTNNYGVQLASDDGSIWMYPDSTTHKMENSQCIVTDAVTDQPDNGWGFKATITFKSGFAGNKNIYMYSTTPQGDETGYQLQGTWTVPSN